MTRKALSLLRAPMSPYQHCVTDRQHMPRELRGARASSSVLGRRTVHCRWSLGTLCACCGQKSKINATPWPLSSATVEFPWVSRAGSASAYLGLPHATQYEHRAGPGQKHILTTKGGKKYYRAPRTKPASSLISLQLRSRRRAALARALDGRRGRDLADQARHHHPDQ